MSNGKYENTEWKANGLMGTVSKILSGQYAQSVC